MIGRWRDYVPEATGFCGPQFSFILAEFGLGHLDSTDLFSRICQRYVGYAKLIHLKKNNYFDSLWGMHGLASMFARKDAKWFISLVNKRLEVSERDKLSNKDVEFILSWVARKYNYWLLWKD